MCLLLRPLQIKFCGGFFSFTLPFLLVSPNTMLHEIIIKVQESDQPNTHEYDIYASDDDYIECNVADGGIIEEQSLEEAIITAAKHASDYIKLHHKK